jgi:TPR repeat protein
MNRGRILEVVLTMLGAVLLLIAAAGKHPYGFYMGLRLVITVGAVYWAWRVYKAGQLAWTWMFVAVALLLNPFLPISMQRAQWQTIDLYLGILLIGWSGYWLFRKRIREFGIKRLAEKKAKEINGAYQWPETGAYQKAGTSTGGTEASTSARAASPKRTSSARGWWTDSTLYRITWTAVCLLLGGGFSLAVSSPDSGLGKIIVSALAFGGFASAAILWSRGISKVLFKIGITNFAMRFMVTGCLIICAIHTLNFVGSLAARSSTPETQLGNSVSGTSAPFHKAAEQGDADAQYNLGVLYYEEWKGQGVPQDDTQAAFWYRTIRAWRAWINSADPYNWRYTQAVYWFRKAAEQGDADAQNVLGNLYYYGHGPLSMELIMYGSYTQAAFWYRKAAEQGNADAQFSLGFLYDNGWGVPQDYEQAAFLYRKAAEQGDADAQRLLGGLYRDGDGVPRDYAQATLWLRKAAEQGDARAQWSLGGLYLGGHGMPRDYAEAYFWYDLAAAGEQDASDSKQVVKYRDEAASHLTPADLFRAQERARKWFEAHRAKPQ